MRAAAVVKELRSTYASGRTKSIEWRVSQLKALLIIATRHEREIVEALRFDLNKPQIEAFVHEISPVASACRFALQELNRWIRPGKAKTSILTFPSAAEIIAEPLGVVLVISTWNYPFLLSLEPVIGAIAAGNAVVLKPSEVAHATSAVLAKLLGHYTDASAVKVVEETTALLEQKWDKIFYTGSGKVGRIILAAAAKHLTPVILELGGKCPTLVDSNTNLKVTARRIIGGKWCCNSGQTCIAPDYVITTKDYASKLIKALSRELEIFRGKNPLESKDLSKIININHFDRLMKMLNDTSSEIVHGGEWDRANLKITPTIVLDAPRDSLVMNEEIFGPLLPIVTVDKIKDSFSVISGKEKPLAAYLFTNDKKLKDEFVKSISAGGIAINDTVIHVTERGLPFGGVGESGTGAYHGKFSFDAFSHRKVVLQRSFSGDADVPYPPYTTGKQQLLRTIVQGNVFGILRALIGCYIWLILGCLVIKKYSQFTSDDIFYSKMVLRCNHG